MPSGLPLRTTSTTTESVTNPLYWLESQLDGTRLALTSFSMSDARENSTTSAFWPAATCFSWVPDGPYDGASFAPAPAVVAWNAGNSFSYAFCGVEYATSLMVLLEPPP